jgi:hypothetical protein
MFEGPVIPVTRVGEDLVGAVPPRTLRESMWFPCVIASSVKLKTNDTIAVRLHDDPSNWHYTIRITAIRAHAMTPDGYYHFNVDAQITRDDTC